MRLISITQELRTVGSPLHRYCRDRFPNVAPMITEFDSRVVTATTLYPPMRDVTPPYSTIGTAIDYRLMYYFWAKPSRTLDAWKGAQYSYVGDSANPVGIPWNPTLPNPGGYTMVTRLMRDFFADLDTLLAVLRPPKHRLAPEQEAQLCRYCYVLALFEEVLRAHSVKPGSQLLAFQANPSATVNDLLELADPWVADLCQLSWLFYEQHRSMLFKHAWIHPNNVYRMAGAAADLLVEGYVIDFKTTVNPKLRPEWLYQVLCYVLLEYPPEHPVHGVGFYLVRQGKLIRWRLEHLIYRLMQNEPVPLEQLQAEFRELLLREYGLLLQTASRSGRRPWQARD